MPIRIKLTVLLCVVAMLPVLIVSSFFYFKMRVLVRDLVLQSSRTMIINKSEKLEAFVRGFHTKPLLMKNLTSFQKMIQSRTSGFDTTDHVPIQVWKERATKTLLKMIHLNPAISRLRYIDENGLEQLRVMPSPGVAGILADEDTKDQSESDYFKQTMTLREDDLYISPLEFIREGDGGTAISHVPVIRLATPIFDSNGERAGIMVLNLLMEKTLAVIRQTEIGQIILIDQDGYFILNQDATKIHNRDLKTRLDYFSEQPELRANLLSFDEFTHHDIKDRGYRVWKKIYYDPIRKDRYWVLIAAITEEELFASSKKMLNLFLIVNTISLFLILIIAALAARSVSRPLQKLREGVEKIGAGNLDEKVGTQAKDELGELSRAFDEMVSKRKKAQDDMKVIAQQLERQRGEERFRFAVEAAPNAMIMVNQAGEITLVNSQTETLFHYTRDELLGRSIEILVPERFRQKHPGYRQGFFALPKTRAMGAGRDLFGLKKDGTEIPIEIGLNPIHMEDELFVLAAIVDITERRKIEKERHDQAAQLMQAEKMSALGTMAAGVAHELSNPMMGILNYVQYSLKHTLVESKAYPVLLDAERETRRCGRIIQDILLFARSTRDDQEVYRDVDCAQMIKQVLGTLEYRIQAEDISVELRLSEDIPAIRMNSDRLGRVFLNLMTNAMDAMKDQRIKILTIKMYAEGGCLSIDFTDSGMGIDPQIISRIFDPFFTTKPTGQGTGLGLSISRSIVSEHNGKLKCQSRLGGGTTFSVVLPMETSSNRR